MWTQIAADKVREALCDDKWGMLHNAMPRILDIYIQIKQLMC